MSPRPATYWKDHRRQLVRLGLCRLSAAHGPALPMRTVCAGCQQKIQQANARRLARRKMPES